MDLPGDRFVFFTKAAGSDSRGQFAHPHGPIGNLAGHLMAATDKERGIWVLSLLRIKKEDRVLEIGFGPGADIQRASEMAADGFVAGIDHSLTMLKQAEKRNAGKIQEGKVQLLQSSIDKPLPFEDGSFSKVYSINSFQFWQKPEESLAELYRVMAPGSTIAIAIQPHGKTAKRYSPHEMGKILTSNLTSAGFAHVRLEVKMMQGGTVKCAVGMKK